MKAALTGNCADVTEETDFFILNARLMLSFADISAVKRFYYGETEETRFNRIKVGDSEYL